MKTPDRVRRVREGAGLTGPAKLAARGRGRRPVMGIGAERNAHTAAAGRPLISPTRPEEEARIRASAAAGSRPDSWTGARPGIDIALPKVLQNGAALRLQFSDADRPRRSGGVRRAPGPHAPHAAARQRAEPVLLPVTPDLMLARSELENLTGLKQPKRMCGWLTTRHWVFEPPQRRGDFPKVDRAYYLARMSGQQPGTKRSSKMNLDWMLTPA